MKYILSAIAILGLSLATPSAEAASFDCSKAKTPYETTICGGSTQYEKMALHDADVKLNKAYICVRETFGDKYRSEQREWMKLQNENIQSYSNATERTNYAIGAASHRATVLMGICNNLTSPELRDERAKHEAKEQAKEQRREAAEAAAQAERDKNSALPMVAIEEVSIIALTDVCAANNMMNPNYRKGFNDIFIEKLKIAGKSEEAKKMYPEAHAKIVKFSKAKPSDFALNCLNLQLAAKNKLQALEAERASNRNMSKNFSDTMNAFN